MARADSGGFDLVLAISPEYLRDKLDDLLPDRFDPKVSFDWDWDAPGPVNIDAHIGLTAHLTLTIEDVIVQRASLPSTVSSTMKISPVAMPVQNQPCQNAIVATMHSTTRLADP